MPSSWVQVPWDIGTFYGFPILPATEFNGPIGLKLAHHHPGISCGPDEIKGDIPSQAGQHFSFLGKEGRIARPAFQSEILRKDGPIAHS